VVAAEAVGEVSAGGGGRGGCCGSACRLQLTGRSAAATRRTRICQESSSMGSREELVTCALQLCQMANCLVWLFYGALKRDPIIASPNLFGLSCGICQVCLGGKDGREHTSVLSHRQTDTHTDTHTQPWDLASTPKI